MPHTFGNKISLFFHGCHDDFSIGECYETGRYVEKDLKTAFEFYQKAAKSGDARACMRFGQFYEDQKKYDLAIAAYEAAARGGNSKGKERLERLTSLTEGTAEYMLGKLAVEEKDWHNAQNWFQKGAAKKHPEAMYELGWLYREDRFSKNKRQKIIQQNIVTELTWYRKAAALYSKHALYELSARSSTDEKAALQLAQMYEQGEGLIRSIHRAEVYYAQAGRLGHPASNFRLGQLYEKGEQDLARDISKAQKYYELAAQKNSRDALSALENLANTSSDSSAPYSVGEIYRLTFRNHMLAAKWYKKAADQKSERAAKQLREIASQNDDIAYMIAQAYEKDFEEKPTTSILPFEFYGLAMRHNHAPSQQHVKELARAGNAQAQYTLSDYYHGQKKTVEAVEWCLKAADQKYDPAIRYLNQTRFSADIYFQIATAYERGNGVTQNFSKAFQFHVKASEAGHGSSSSWLGQWYQTDHEHEQQDDEKAFDYYMKALRQGWPEAAVPLERLGEERSAQKKRELGDLYGGYPVRNAKKASYWYARAAETDRRNIQCSVTSSRSTGYDRSLQKYSEAMTHDPGGISSSSSSSSSGSSASFFSISRRENRLEAQRILLTLRTVDCS